MNIASVLEQRHYKFERLPHSPTYDAQHLAHELHVPGCQVAKTVLLHAIGTQNYVVAVLPAHCRIDFEQLSELLDGVKFEMATEFDIWARCIDCDFGVLPPFGSQYGMQTVVDSQLVKYPYIWFEANTYDEAIRMKVSDFFRLEHPIVGPFCCSGGRGSCRAECLHRGGSAGASLSVGF